MLLLDSTIDSAQIKMGTEKRDNRYLYRLYLLIMDFQNNFSMKVN